MGTCVWLVRSRDGEFDEKSNQIKSNQMEIVTTILIVWMSGADNLI